MLAELYAALRRESSAAALLTPRGNVAMRRGELADLADGYAAALHHRGLTAGDTVGFAVRPGGRSLALLMAAYRLGIRAAVLDPRAGPEVLRARLASAAPTLVLADAAAQAVAGWAAPLARRAHLALPELSSLGDVVTVGRRFPGCAPALRPRQAGQLPDHRGADGDAIVIFTSGTTSLPRAVVHTWSSLDAGMHQLADLVRPQAGVPVLGGMFLVLVPSLAAGAPVSLPGQSLARQLLRLRPQHTYLTPPQLRSTLDAGGRFTGSVWSGSAPVSASLLSRVRAAGAAEAYGVYALTEMFPVAVVQANAKANYHGEGDLIGEPLPGVSTRLDAAGQLLLSGPGMADRYLGESKMEEVQTGDLARIEQGQVILGGRSKDMILRETRNIYPGLHEPALHVPGVALAIIVGIPAGEGDERAVAIVECTPGADKAAVRHAVGSALDGMGADRPDELIFAPVPLAGRSRKPDRPAASRLAVAELARRSRLAEAGLARRSR
jgi:acyl-CoA synthetase (AMP-forming)/AMP-acid ligase II